MTPSARSRSTARERTPAIPPGEATDQIIASLRPVLKKAPITLSVEVPEGLMIDSYPARIGSESDEFVPYAASHGFATGEPGHYDFGQAPR